VKKDGYLAIKVDKSLFLAHRLAWLHTHGEWPKGQIDHINGIRSDNRLQNLRDVDLSANAQNQRAAHKNNVSCGMLGVTGPTSAGKWRAQIVIVGRKTHIGVYEAPAIAHAAYLSAKVAAHQGYVA
jgi:hypothetical protein